MGHCIEAIIARRPIAEEKARELGLAVAYEGDFAIVILYEDAWEVFMNKFGLEWDEIHEDFNTPAEVIFFIAAALWMGEFAFIKTDYFGGMGYQYALYCADGAMQSDEHNINAALRRIGVVAAEGLDEFDTINLGKYRGTEEYYWNSEHNPAFRLPNMIPGRILK